MNILIDIKHPAQLNLFKKLSQNLKSKGWNVIICYLNRGKLPRIIEKEYPDFECIKIGSSKGTKWSIFWNGNVVRTWDFVKLLKGRNIKIAVAASSAPLALACKITRTPIIQFYDDPERKRINKVNEILSNRLFFPPIIVESAKVNIFNCLKEWSYLSPTYFSPNPAILDKLALTQNGYVFVREVSNKSFNYYDQQDAIILSFSSQINTNIPVILSLEDKSITNKFPKHWKILEEPIEDIHSLIYYSKLVVSSGDSMAREGAMLGVPSVYCGVREMKANELLIKKGILEHHPMDAAVKAINSIITRGFDKENQEFIRSKLLGEWDDMNQFMEQQILKYKK